MAAEIYRWRLSGSHEGYPVRLLEAEENRDGRLHWHELLELHYITEGTFTCTCLGRTVTLEAGDVFFTGWCVPHRIVPDSKTARCTILQVDLSYLFSDTRATGLCRFGDLMTIHADCFQGFLRGDETVTGLLDQIISVYGQQEFGWELLLKGLLLTLMSRLFSRYFHREAMESGPLQEDSALRYTRWILSYIAGHYTGSIDLDHIAGELGLTKSYICRIFRRHTGTTIMQYTNHLRCYQAIHLVETGVSVTQAALQVGFNDYNYFSRVFKKTIGRRPSDFTGGAAALPEEM